MLHMVERPTSTGKRRAAHRNSPDSCERCPVKVLTILTLVLALFVASVALTSISLLASLCDPADDIRLEELAAGKLGRMWTGPSLWSAYPTVPPLSAMLDNHAIMLTAAVIAAIVYVLRIRLALPLGLTSLAVLLAGAVPYSLGRMALMSGPVRPDECGPWLAVMVVGVLYFSVAGATLSGLELTGVHERLQRRLGGLRRRLPVGVDGPPPSTPVGGSLTGDQPA